jgi:hypothetical protein
MIGYNITGTDLFNKPVTGKILDTIICPQMVPVGPPLQQQMMPIACTAYLVQCTNTGKLFIVPPPAITELTEGQ